jgi:hypothetical protein
VRTSPFRSTAYRLRCKTEKFVAILFPRRSRYRCLRTADCRAPVPEAAAVHPKCAKSSSGAHAWRTDTANQRGGEWMGADKNSSRKRWKLQKDEHGFQHMSPTHYPSWSSPCSHWSATRPRNQHTTFRPENAAEHQTSSPQTHTGQTGEHHRSDRSLLVKLRNFH